MKFSVLLAVTLAAPSLALAEPPANPPPHFQALAPERTKSREELQAEYRDRSAEYGRRTAAYGAMLARPGGALDYEYGLEPGDVVRGEAGVAIGHLTCGEQPMLHRPDFSGGRGVSKGEQAALTAIGAAWSAVAAIEDAALDKRRKEGCRLLQGLRFGGAVDAARLARRNTGLARFHPSYYTPGYGVLTIDLGRQPQALNLERTSRHNWVALGVRDGKIEWQSSRPHLCQTALREPKPPRPGCRADNAYDPAP